MGKSPHSKNPLDSAHRFLSYRARSEAEVRRRLLRSFDPLLVNDTISYLRSRGLLDDHAFARFWRQNRERFRPRSRSMIQLELLRLGVCRDIIDETLEGFDEATSAIQAGRKLIRRLHGVDLNTFRHKLDGYLKRRGFSYDVVSSAIQHLWLELTNPIDSYVEGDGQENQS